MITKNQSLFTSLGQALASLAVFVAIESVRVLVHTARFHEKLLGFRLRREIIAVVFIGIFAPARNDIPLLVPHYSSDKVARGVFLQIPFFIPHDLRIRDGVTRQDRAEIKVVVRELEPKCPEEYDDDTADDTLRDFPLWCPTVVRRPIEHCLRFFLDFSLHVLHINHTLVLDG